MSTSNQTFEDERATIMDRKGTPSNTIMTSKPTALKLKLSSQIVQGAKEMWEKHGSRVKGNFVRSESSVKMVRYTGMDPRIISVRLSKIDSEDHQTMAQELKRAGELGICQGGEIRVLCQMQQDESVVSTVALYHLRPGGQGALCDMIMMNVTQDVRIEWSRILSAACFAGCLGLLVSPMMGTEELGKAGMGMAEMGLYTVGDEVAQQRKQFLDKEHSEKMLLCELVRAGLLRFKGEDTIEFMKES